MHFSTLTTILLAATGISAFPALQKRLDAIPLSIYPSTGCNSGPTPLTTAFIPTDGSCFGISPIVSGNTDSGIISQSQLLALPAGCTLVAYSDSTCSSVNNIVYDVTGRCGTFGAGKLIHSAKTVGTCA
ncbi:hypothetical protein CC86DRAFT_38293 [Ophiobolus disseminans]|uniref:Uncharacterized protein n=1 Tax=Ophiobolus disseminans TaxID=1469910 RepID=A0A6A7A022_9PLEO|nr:hypothetical protein CC86DRAFT_38293 [Ophiobolus disseminans]